MGDPTSPGLDSTKGKHKPTASWAKFLESYPPGVQALISDLVEVGRAGPTAPAEYHLALPDLQLHCDHSSCDGVRFFECGISRPWISEEAKSSFIVYKCRNCEQTEKLFALLFRRKGQGPTGEAVKIGEWPPFGPPVPARVIKSPRQSPKVPRQPAKPQSWHIAAKTKSRPIRWVWII